MRRKRKMVKDKPEIDIDCKEKCIELKNKIKAKVEENPIASTGIGLGVGLGFGIIGGYILGRLTKCHQD